MTDCRKLDKELERFLDDPMTIAYGAQDCADLVVKNHLKSCKRCKKLREKENKLHGRAR